MNKIIFIIILGVIGWAFTACEEEHPGYLFSSEAAYPIDSLVVQTPTSQQQAIAEMQAIKEAFENTEEGKALYQKIAELNQRANDEEEKLYDETDILWGLEDALYEYDEGSPEYNEAYAKWEVQAAICDSIEAIKSNILRIQIPELEKQIEANIGNIDSEIVLMQRRLDNKVAYSTSVIDKIQGTSPIMYTIAAIRTEGEGDTDKFAKYLSVMGSGRFIVTWDENIPTGRYVISLYVENEGWKDLLSDVFTVIVK